VPDDLYHELPGTLLCMPKEPYDDLKAKGYAWNKLLDTSGWWTIEDGSEKELPSLLSTMNLWWMRLSKYHPCAGQDSGES